MAINDFTEREERIINAAVERAFLMMPEAVESLIMQKTTTKKLATELFSDNKGFSQNLDLVQSIIEKTEMENPGLSYGKIIELATPKIKEKIQVLAKMDYKPVPRPSMALVGERVQGDHGEL